jgi:photosystem II stability/assembly factor-like uncharacterized protein
MSGEVNVKKILVAIACMLAFFVSAAYSSTLDGTHVHGLAYDPADPSRLLIATHHGLLAYQGGELVSVSEHRHDFMGFAIHPGGAGVLVASGHPVSGGNLGIIISRDGGRTWQTLSAGADGPVDFHQMDVSRANPDVMVGVHGDVQASRDGGHTWTVTGSPPAPMISIALSPIDPTSVYAATRAGLFKSSDLGATWVRAKAGEGPVTMVSAADDGSLYAYDLVDGLIHLAPGAEQWTSIGEPLQDDAILHFTVKEREMAAATHAGRLVKSIDGGKSWRSLVD